MAQAKVGVVGLGNMGRGVAGNLHKAKISLMVWDVASEAREPWERKRGVEVLEPGEMAGQAGIIFFVVPGSPEIEAALKGRNGVLANARKNLVIYDFTSSDPAVSRKIARRAKAKGVAYLDAGMSGGATGAAAGTLTLMIGGDEKAYRRTKRFLTPIADDLFYLGESGAGHAMKLIHNMVCHSIFMATCEGGKLAEKVGLKVEDMIDVFNVSNARSYASQFRFPNHILSEKWDGKSRVYNMIKDVGMAVQMGKKHRAHTEHGEATLSFLEKAVKRGMIEKDFTLLYRDYEKVAKTRL
ncbi:MAG: NAD(P)-dependent oxidoreductase [Nitrospinae bacterium]|nr:NAD(P)-dependent oxidoreductase [Nitrospinota bacterium]